MLQHNTSVNTTHLARIMIIMYHHFLWNNGHCYDFCCTGISGRLMSDASLTHISSSLMIQKPTNGVLIEHVAYCRSKWATTQTTPAWLQVRKQLNTCLTIDLFICFFVAFYFAFFLYLKDLYRCFAWRKTMIPGLLNTGNPTFCVGFTFFLSFFFPPTHSGLGMSPSIYSCKNPSKH